MSKLVFRSIKEPEQVPAGPVVAEEAPPHRTTSRWYILKINKWVRSNQPPSTFSLSAGSKRQKNYARIEYRKSSAASQKNVDAFLRVASPPAGRRPATLARSHSSQRLTNGSAPQKPIGARRQDRKGLALVTRALQPRTRRPQCPTCNIDSRIIIARWHGVESTAATTFEGGLGDSPPFSASRDDGRTRDTGR